MADQKTYTLEDLMTLSRVRDDAQRIAETASKDVGQAERRAAKKSAALAEANAQLAAAKAAYAKQAQK